MAGILAPTGPPIYVQRSKPARLGLYGLPSPIGRPAGRADSRSLPDMTPSTSSEAASTAGEREFQPRAVGSFFPWVKWASLIELAIFGCLLVVWLLPGLEQPTFWFGLAHGVGFLILCAMIWVAVLRREAPFWLLASALTPVGPVGSTLGIAHIERRERAATPSDH